MSMELEYTIFKTAMGWVGILGSDRGLLSTTLPQPSAQEAKRLLGDKINQAVQFARLFADLAARLKAYFSGHRVAFPDRLDLSAATLFQSLVWQATRLIPYGEVKSYLWLAEQIKQPRAVRAVGQALARNPLPVVVPCHRVIASDGRLGGFSGGVEVKRHLLQLEANS